MKPFDHYVAAWEQTSGSLLELCGRLPDQSWSTPTECPGWSVKDVAAHVAGLEAFLLGRPRPAGAGGADRPSYVRTEVGRFVEADIQVRRAVPPTQIVAELDEVLAARRTQLRESPPDPDQPVFWATGPTTMTGLMRMRVFDVWVHEQDIRYAVDLPGNLSGPAADVTADMIVASLPKTVAKKAGAAPGTTVVVESTGATRFTVAVWVDANGRGAVLPLPLPLSSVPATATLRLDWVDLVRLGAGRCTREDVAITFEGDRELGRRFAGQLSFTP